MRVKLTYTIPDWNKFPMYMEVESEPQLNDEVCVNKEDGSFHRFRIYKRKYLVSNYDNSATLEAVLL